MEQFVHVSVVHSGLNLQCGGLRSHPWGPGHAGASVQSQDSPCFSSFFLPKRAQKNSIRVLHGLWAVLQIQIASANHTESTLATQQVENLLFPTQQCQPPQPPRNMCEESDAEQGNKTSPAKLWQGIPCCSKGKKIERIKRSSQTCNLSAPSLCANNIPHGKSTATIGLEVVLSLCC